MSVIITPTKKIRITTAHAFQGYWKGYILYVTFEGHESFRRFFDSAQEAQDYSETFFPGEVVYYEIYKHV